MRTGSDADGLFDIATRAGDRRHFDIERELARRAAPGGAEIHDGRLSPMRRAHVRGPEVGTAVVATGDQAHPAALEGLERSDVPGRVACESVVDELESPADARRSRGGSEGPAWTRRASANTERSGHLPVRSRLAVIAPQRLSRLCLPLRAAPGSGLE